MFNAKKNAGPKQVQLCVYDARTEPVEAVQVSMLKAQAVINAQFELKRINGLKVSAAHKAAHTRMLLLTLAEEFVSIRDSEQGSRVPADTTCKPRVSPEVTS